jgi:hypothetical protein
LTLLKGFQAKKKNLLSTTSHTINYVGSTQFSFFGSVFSGIFFLTSEARVLKKEVSKAASSVKRQGLNVK